LIDNAKQFQNKYNNYNKFGTNVNPNGFLSVAVHDRISNKSITFAEVSIYFLNIRGLYGEAGDANLVVRHVTDEEGKVPLIELPVINRNIYPNSQYYMTVRHFRYYPVNIMNILIYANVTTTFNILLTNLSSRQQHFEFIITPELENMNID